MEGLNITQLESLQSKDQAALLDTVDEIRRHGVNRYISLPQLIVCGDQSSGKSSVLEAISGVQFPVNDGLCTRFTTEVVLRRASDQLASVKVIPAKDATREHREKLMQFEKRSIGHGEIPALISEAKAIMGLQGNSTLSRDVLQLEVSGPKLPHLTLVDLPGLIHHPNKEQSEEDVKIPKELVQKYMKQPRSIVLAIVTAKNDVSNQIVLKFAKAADPHGSRTMGIITKPDCLKENDPNESAFFTLANNKETYLQLDWHVLRNADHEERKDPDFNRDDVEKGFFTSRIWKNLPSFKRGVDSLRSRLSHILFQQIQKELPGLVIEIENELKLCKTTLDRLGPPRDDPTSRRVYLTSMAARFHDLVRAGNEGYYQDPFFTIDVGNQRGTSNRESAGRECSTRLRANLRREELNFAEEMHTHGHTHEIVASPIASRLHAEGQPRQVTEDAFLQDIRTLLSHSKGRELPGTFTPLLVGELFIRQSKNWRTIALKFVTDVWNIVKQFLDDVLSQVADESVRRAVLEEIIDPPMDTKLVALKDKVDEILSPYSNGYPLTLNRRFLKEIERQRTKIMKGTDDSFSEDDEDPDDRACQELLLLMKAYYAVALDVFVDNVAALVIENCLMRDLKDLLSPLTISEMEDAQLESIASESDEIREVRNQVEEKKTALQKSFDVCRRHERKIASNRLNDRQNGQSLTPSAEEVEHDQATSTNGTPTNAQNSTTGQGNQNTGAFSIPSSTSAQQNPNTPAFGMPNSTSTQENLNTPAFSIPSSTSAQGNLHAPAFGQSSSALGQGNPNTPGFGGLGKPRSTSAQGNPHAPAFGQSSSPFAPGSLFGSPGFSSAVSSTPSSFGSQFLPSPLGGIEPFRTQSPGSVPSTNGPSSRSLFGSASKKGE
jgi:GTPase SAR1 family protein/Tfp pilus assembly major pilin PilA